MIDDIYAMSIVLRIDQCDAIDPRVHANLWVITHSYARESYDAINDLI